jgi:hypothetical protein
MESLAMFPRSTLGTIFVVALAACATPHPKDTTQEAASVPAWQLVYRHDADGKPIAGTKQELLEAIRRGSPIRFAWGFKVERDNGLLSVEHVAEPVFLSIINQSDVVVHLPEHIAQESYGNLSRALFDNPAVMWRGLMTTQGTFDAVWVNRATGDQVRRHSQRVGLSWFAFQPLARGAQQAPLEIAVHGGVRSEGSPK